MQRFFQQLPFPLLQEDKTFDMKKEKTHRALAAQICEEKDSPHIYLHLCHEAQLMESEKSFYLK